ALRVGVAQRIAALQVAPEVVPERGVQPRVELFARRRVPQDVPEVRRGVGIGAGGAETLVAELARTGAPQVVAEVRLELHPARRRILGRDPANETLGVVR